MKTKKMTEALKSAEKWSPGEILDLIGLWAEKQEDLGKMGPKHPIYHRMSVALKECNIAHPERTAFEVQDKIQYLRDTYRKFVNKKKQTGSGTDDVKWIYFEKIHEFLGTRPSFNEEYAQTSDTFEIVDPRPSTSSGSRSSVASQLLTEKENEGSAGSSAGSSVLTGNRQNIPGRGNKNQSETEDDDVVEEIMADEEPDPCYQTQPHKKTKHAENSKKRFSVGAILEKQAILLQKFEDSIKEDEKTASELVKISKENNELLRTAMENQAKMLDLMMAGFSQGSASSSAGLQTTPLVPVSQVVRPVATPVTVRLPAPAVLSKRVIVNKAVRPVAIPVTASHSLSQQRLQTPIARARIQTKLPVGRVQTSSEQEPDPTIVKVARSYYSQSH